MQDFGPVLRVVYPDPDGVPNPIAAMHSSNNDVIIPPPLPTPPPAPPRMQSIIHSNIVVETGLKISTQRKMCILIASEHAR